MSQAGSIVPAVVAQVVDLLRDDAAIAARLTNAAGVVQVWNVIPAGTVAPYLWIWSGSEEDDPVKLGPGRYARTCTVIVIPVSTHYGTKEIDELAGLAMEVLARVPLEVPGYGSAGIVWCGPNPEPTAEEFEGSIKFSKRVYFRASAR